MKKTAVEWLAKELESYGDPQICKITWEDLDSLVNQAIEMEKQQIVDAYRVGKVEATLPPEKLNTGGKYYRELFKPE